MRITLTKFGWPQVVLLPAAILCAMALLLRAGPLVMPAWAVGIMEAGMGALLIFTLAFFRDPQRDIRHVENALLAPADGTVTGVELVEENDFIGGTALRVTIFLNIFNVHINRAPCDSTVSKITYKPGRFKNAINPESARVNESNDLWLVRKDYPEDKLILRQISGAVARRIVCVAAEGQDLASGEKFGMIKFGSGTELYVAVRKNARCLVKTGDKVKAGLSPIVRYE